MVKLTLTNRKVRIEGAKRKVIRAIEAATSYKVAGRQFVQSFRAKHWDGKEHLLTFSAKSGYTAPAGLLPDIVACVRGLGIRLEVVDNTCLRAKREPYAWNESIKLRGYQNRAVRGILKCDPMALGVMKMPIRSGKTKTAARVISLLGLPTLFIVPSTMLLRQTFEAFTEALPGADIGLIGDGEYRLGRITIATIQTLASMRGRRKTKTTRAKRPDPRYKALLTTFDLMICDEAHHIRGDGDWYKVPYDFDCRFKIGLSATVFPESDVEMERGIIWLKAVCGPIRVNVSTSELVDDGYLMRQHVRMIQIAKPDLSGHKWSNTLRIQAITQNTYRNKIIARLTKRQVAKEQRVLIVANRHDHIACICEELDSEGVDYRTITGRDGGEAREEKVDGFVAGDYRVLIGTVLGEGVDIPVADCVINAEGGQDDKATVQRQRNLTISAGKRLATLYDFMDVTNHYFEKHSKARLEAYRAEPSFSVEVIHLSDPLRSKLIG